ncbi:PAS domain-containing sensor histidine kinase [Pedobacter sp. SD-b]|uniref:histidine kinase n=1 Tax=Pedobacter segetis TaxID=2793069 RepID=A0ABS1BMZ6_9SPHI|nr:PAS domain-containing sensor histidine kinase [Pedobacter segetis]MBK0384274.1 PAS domain-containing sensor histidine kinase [Pedobacter segetis]
MERLIREKDWSKTSVGNPVGWPQSLRTALSIVLSSKFPGFIFWGKDHLCFYNDAYRPSLGNEGKHPNILGQMGKDAWPEIWDIIYPLINQVFITGLSTWSEDQLIPIYRNGKIEDVYWTFSYSPIFDESDSIAGVLTTCVETTKDVYARRQLERANKQYYENIMQAPVAMCIFKGRDYIVEIANEMMLELWGKNASEVLNKPIFEGLPEAKDQGLEDLMNQVFTTGIKFEAFERPVLLPRNGVLETFYLNFVYQPVKDEEGKVISIFAMATDLTPQVLSKQKIIESEDRLKIVIDASRLGVWEYDVKEKKGIFSDRYAQIFGFENRDKLDSTKIIKLLHPDEEAIRSAANNKVIETGYLNYETKIFWEDGSIHWIEANGKLFYDEDNNPAKMIGTIKDITNEKKYEKDLVEREEKFRLLANEMPQFVWIGNTKGILTYFNKSVYKYTGLDESILENNGWAEIVHPDDREINFKLWKDAVKTGNDFLCEHRFVRKDGQYRWQLSRAKPFKDDQGNIKMWVGTSTDIHDIKELDQQKDFFISMASHELKTPITSVKGYVQLLSNKYKNSNDAFLNNALNILNKQVVTLTTLVSDLLDVSKINMGSLLLRKTKFAINDLVEDVIEEIQHINQKHQIIFCKEANSKVFADRENIAQVLVNFLTNAVKYSPGSLNVEVKSSVINNRVRISVKDKGIGLKEEDRKKVFERFYRVEGKNEKTFPGFGIGLFIASEIIRKHNGKIWVDSKIGEGSTFYFELPIEA